MTALFTLLPPHKHAERGDVLWWSLWAGTPRVGPPGGWQAAYRATKAATAVTISHYMVQLDWLLWLWRTKSDDRFILDSVIKLLCLWEEKLIMTTSETRLRVSSMHHGQEGWALCNTSVSMTPEFHCWYQNKPLWYLTWRIINLFFCIVSYGHILVRTKKTEV